MRRRLLLTFIAPLLCVAALCAAPGSAHATQELTVYVGYSGGPYYEKHVYSVEELESLADDCYYAYSAIDNQPSLVKYVAWGVTLETLFANATDSIVGTGVNVDALWRLAFDTDDDYKPDDGIYGNNVWYWDHYSNYQSGYVLNPAKTTRYYYSALAEYFDFSLRRIIDGTESEIVATGSEVPSIIALKYVKTRIESVEDWNNLDAVLSDTDIPSALSTIGEVDTRNRLLFGQTSPSEQEVENEVHSITGLYCIYQGTPTISLSQTQITGVIGESVTVNITIEADDDLIEALGPADVVLTSENEDVATVVNNGDGTATVTIVGKGDVEITASFGESSSGEFVTSTSMTVSGPGGSGWREEGEGTGWEYGDGDGEQGFGGGSGSSSSGDGGDGSSSETENGNSGDSGSSGGEGGESSALDDDSSQEDINLDDARSVAISSTDSDASEDGSSAGAMSDNEEEETEVTEEDLRIYAITESSEEVLADTRQIYWECMVAILVLMTLSAAAQVLYFRRSLDRSVARKIRRSDSASNAPPTGPRAVATG